VIHLIGYLYSLSDAFSQEPFKLKHLFRVDDQKAVFLVVSPNCSFFTLVNQQCFW
jgi:hypothetical protein